jgi:hypothetical protein
MNADIKALNIECRMQNAALTQIPGIILHAGHYSD